MRTKLEIPRTAYPLTWPPGVAREKLTRTSDFHDMRTEYYEGTEWRNGQSVKVSRSRKVRAKLTVASARQDVQAELQRLGAGEPVVISSNMKLRLDGLPASNASEPFDSGVAVYFMLDGHETCIAIDRYSRVADNLRAVAKTIEAMRGIERWGGASLVAAAFTGFQALPGPSAIVPPRPWHEVLMVAAHAPTEDVEWKARVMSAAQHPDKGGDTAKFVEIRDALEAFRRERGIAS